MSNIYKSIYYNNKYNAAINMINKLIQGLYIILVFCLIDNNHENKIIKDVVLLSAVVICTCLQVIVLNYVNKEKLCYILSLLNDSVYIGLTFYFYPTFNLQTVGFLSLVILHYSLSKFLYIKITYLGFLWLLISLIVNDFSKILLGVFLIYAFSAIVDSIVKRIEITRTLLNNIIDNVFADSGGEIRQMYSRAIELLNELSSSNNQRVYDIYCFEYDGNSVYLVNGSSFVWSYYVDLNFLNEKVNSYPTMIRNINITLDSNKVPENLCFIRPSKYNKSIFLFAIRTSNNFFYYNYYKFLLNPFFSRMALINESYLNRKKKQSNEFEGISHKFTYVNMATTTLHFIRNKLTPVKNYVSMYKLYESSNVKEEKKKIQHFLRDELRQMEKSYHQIINRSDRLLSEKWDISDFAKTESLEMKDLFTEIKEQWRSYQLDPETVHSDLSNTGGTELRYNKEGMALVIDNCVSNISKYNDGIYEALFVEDSDKITITFKNSVNKKSRIDSLIVKNYNKNWKREEIDKRDLHGLQFIRDICIAMGVKSSLKLDEEKQIFSIIIEVIKIKD